MSDTLVLDSSGVPITVGARVNVGSSFAATVVELTDPDGDVNVHGRPVARGPYVIVQYDDDGSRENFQASWNATGPWDDHRTDYTCDDVTVAS